MPSPGGQFLSGEFGDIEDYFISDYQLIDQYIGDQLLVWGRNFNSQLGIGVTTNNIITPVTTFAGRTNWKSVNGGRNHTAAIKTDGTLWTWGRNDYGQLGINNTIDRSTPVTTFAGGTDWKSVSSGGYHTAAIKTDGTLWSWGRNDIGPLGDNTNINRSTPVTTFSGGTNWKQVSCGYYHTAAIKTDGTLWTWGYTLNGRLGNNDTTYNKSTPLTTFAGGTNWKSVSSGAFHTVAIKTDGSLWVWGSNFTGQLGINESGTVGDKSTPVTTFAGGNNWRFIDCGSRYTLSIKTDGTLWSWGRNFNSQLGINNTIDRSTPVTTFAGGNNWKSVSCGNDHTAAIKTDGTLWTWGRNDFGAVGDNTSRDRSTPVTTFAGGTNWKSVSCGIFHTAAIKSGLNVDLS